MPTARVLWCVGALSLALGCAQPESLVSDEVTRLNAFRWTASPGTEGALASLEDRELSSKLAVGQPLELKARFDGEVRLSHLKVYGARNVELELDGNAWAPAESGAWQRRELAQGPRRELTVRVRPLGPDAAIGEVELWGRGKGSVPRRPGLWPALEPGRFDNLLRSRAEPEAATLAPGTQSPCVELAVALEKPPGALRRVFLAYSASGIGRASSLVRTVNGWPAAGGFWVSAGEGKRWLLDELDARQLGRANHVSLCLPPEATGAVALEDIRLLAELDDGTNLLDRDSEAAAGEAWDADVATARVLGPVQLSLSRPAELERAWVRFDAPALPPARVEVGLGGEWQVLGDVPGNVATTTGLVEVKPAQAGLRLDAVRLDVPAAVQVAELGLAASPVGPRRPAVVVTFPDDGAHFGNRAFVAGFVDGEDKSDVVSVSVNGEATHGGAWFAQELRREGASSEPWTVRIEATLRGGRTLEKTLVLGLDRSEELRASGGGSQGPAAGDESLYGAVDELATAAVGAEGGEVRLGDRIKLKVPPGALAQKAQLSVQRRASTSVPPLDADLLNVTAPAGSGYKFRPAGQRFAQPVRVELPYDATLLPPGIPPEEIRTYYFDEALERWLPLAKVAVHRTREVVESETSHFTFMVNAVLSLPEHPGPSSFNPTSLKDLKAADPSEGIDLVEAPSGNNQGSANLAYPLRLPPGRGAFSPSLKLVYDSASANGWLGAGWSLPVSSVEVDTRFGVPGYAEGTEVYVLDGEMLVPLADESCADGTAGKRFMKRVERDFLRIRRCGTVKHESEDLSATPFYWEVTAKDGTTLYYGRTQQARLSDYAAPGYIARWALEEVEDAHGNGTHYVYASDDETLGCPSGEETCEPFRQLYLSAVTYTDNPLAPQPLAARYMVSLHSRAGERPDTFVSGRTGFKVVTRRLLERVVVSLGAQKVREYRLDYEAGDFGKNLLARVTAYGADGTRFHQHEFDYERKQGGQAFSSPVQFGGAADAFSISNSEESSNNAQLYVGVTPSFAPAVTVGVRGGYDGRSQAVTTLLADLNGDNLPDRLRSSEGQFLAQFNQATPRMEQFVPASGDFAFSPLAPSGDVYAGRTPSVPVPVQLGQEQGHTFSGGLEVQLGHPDLPILSGGFSLGVAYGNSETQAAVMDANGDGLLDRVSASGVLFQKERRPGCAAGDLTCAPPDTVAFQAGEELAPDAAELLLTDAELRAARDAAKKEFYPEDALLQWVAPYDGAITVETPVKRRGAGGEDGVRLELFKNNDRLPFTVDGQPAAQPFQVAAADTSLHTLRATTQVVKGDRLYFKVGTGEHFAVRAGTPPEPLDEVLFDPAIRYSGRDSTLRDAAGGKLFEYVHSEDFRITGDPIIGTVVGVNGRVRLTTTVTKAHSSDGVHLCLQRFPAGTTPQSSNCAGDTLLEKPASASGTFTDVREVEVVADEQLVFRQESDAPLDPGTTQAQVTVELVSACDTEDSSTCQPVAPGSPEAQPIFAPVYTALHRAPASPVTPWVVPESGEYDVSGTLGAVTGAAFAVVTRNGEQIFKRQVGVTLEETPLGRLSLTAGEQLVFEVHAERPTVASWGVRVDRIRHVNGSETRQRIPVSANVTWCFTLLDDIANMFFRDGRPLSGGYRGWRYAQWNGDKPFDEAKFTQRPEYDVGGDEDRFIDEASDGVVDGSERESNVLETFAPLAPAPGGVTLSQGLDGGLWQGPDGFTYIGPGYLHAGRKGGYEAGAPEGGVHGGVLAAFRLGRQVRAAASVSLSAGLSVAGLSGNLSYGWSDQKLDVLDMNGDGVADMVRPGSVNLTTRAFTRSPEDIPLVGETSEYQPPGGGPVETAPSGIRHTEDVSASFGLGMSSLVERVAGSAIKSLASTRMPVQAGLGLAVTRQAVRQDLVDMNGDGLPDRVQRDGGHFKVYWNFGNRFASTPDTLAVSDWGTALDGFAEIVTPGEEVAGDGSAAQKRRERQATLAAKYDFANAPDVIQHTTGISFIENLGLATRYFGVSRQNETSLTRTSVQLLDVTGDGVPDYVKKGATDEDFLVQVNLGHGFSAPVPFSAPAWRFAGNPLRMPCFKSRRLISGVPSLNEITASLVGHEASMCGSEPVPGLDTIAVNGVHTARSRVGGGIYFTIPIPLAAVTLTITPSFDHAERDSGFELGMVDVNGDGLADHVLKTAEGERVYARLNELGGGNLLKAVRRPLGGEIRLAYARLGNTVAMPGSRWVLARVEVDDRGSKWSAPGDRGHVLVSRYEYQEGRFHRYEKDFFGFRVVRRLEANGNVTEQRFRTDEYARKGTLEAEEVRDAGGDLLGRMEYGHGVLELASGGAACVQKLPYPLNRSDEACKVRFVSLSSEQQTRFEGAGQVTTRSTYRHDCEQPRGGHACYGNLVEFRDEGGPGTDDDMVAVMQYSADVAGLRERYIVGKERSLTVTGAAGEVLREREVLRFNAAGDVEKLSSLVDAKRHTRAVYNMEWTPEGNLGAFVDAPNQAGQAYRVEYTYDDSVRTYVALIRDSHGLSSTATHDFRFGETTLTVDANGRCTARQLDEFGRLTALYGPREFAGRANCEALPATPTIQVTYHHPRGKPAYAITRHKLPARARTLDTVVLMDGLGRVVQTKKTAEVASGVATKVGYSVSGHVLYDAMGRVESEGQPIFDSVLAEGSYVGPPGGELRNPREFTYDAKGRATKVLEPDGAKTAISFGIDSAASQAWTRVEDAEGKVRTVYRDAKARVVAVAEHLGERELVTRYGYNPLDELVQVVDAKGNTTTASYDALGRRTALFNPDTGPSAYEYDDAGNLTAQADARGRRLEYRHDFNRLVQVVRSSGAGVTYRYGGPGAPENGAGRVVEVVDEGGVETRGYDELGAVARTTRRVAPLRPGEREAEYTTRFKFDAFGRMLWLEYPDGERLTYGYDAGGLLRSAAGKRHAEEEAYLVDVRYDEFGSRVSLTLGNGTRTSYSYEAPTRRLHHLRTTLPQGRSIQELVYGYDKAGNVTSITNALGEPTGRVPGSVTQSFRYDDLHRLTGAEGVAKVAPRTTDTYAARFEYDAIHNLTRKVQTHVLFEPSGQEVRHRATNHDWTYQYEGPKPHAATRVGDAVLQYDEAGNTVYEEGGTKPRRRRYTWTDEGWLREVVDNGDVTSFLYDASGQRVAKRGKYGETAYVGQFYSVRNGTAGTKHIFAGQARLASKTGAAPRTGSPADASAASVLAPQQPGIARACEVGLGKKVGLEGRCEVVEPGVPAGGGAARERTYYYHPDHLGSSSYLTDARGDVFEHVEYFPYGEAWLEDGPRRPSTDFRFTGKPQDPETGLTYFGARYYDARRARWLSPDPEWLSQGPVGLNVYQYADWSPIQNIDPDGRAAVPKSVLERERLGLASLPAPPPGYSYMPPAEDRLRADRSTPAQRAEAVARFENLLELSATYPGVDPLVAEWWERRNAEAAQVNGGWKLVAALGGLTKSGGQAVSARSPPRRSPGAAGASRARATTTTTTTSPTAYKKVDAKTRQRILQRDQQPDGSWTCATCGQTTKNPANIHTGHITARSKGGDLSDANLRSEGAACNLSQGAREAPREGRTCADRGSCGAPYGRTD